jgi:hypothetical protein
MARKLIKLETLTVFIATRDAPINIIFCIIIIIIIVSSSSSSSPRLFVIFRKSLFFRVRSC